MERFRPAFARTFLPGFSLLPAADFAPGGGDKGVNLLDFRFRFLPVVAELPLAAHRPLMPGRARPVFPEAMERLEHGAVGEGGETDNAHVDADHRSGRVYRSFHLPLRLDTDIPFASGKTDGDVSHRPQYLAAVAIAQTPSLRQEDAAVGLIELALFRVGVAESVVPPLFLESGKTRPPGEEIGVGAL